MIIITDTIVAIGTANLNPINFQAKIMTNITTTKVITIKEY
jgi:hypothetical protein